MHLASTLQIAALLDAVVRTQLRGVIHMSRKPPLIAVANTSTDGTIITVLEMTTVQTQFRLELGNWHGFRPASAGHRLIENGYMIDPQMHNTAAGNVSGWILVPGAGWITRVIEYIAEPECGWKIDLRELRPEEYDEDVPLPIASTLEPAAGNAYERDVRRLQAAQLVDKGTSA